MSASKPFAGDFDELVAAIAFFQGKEQTFVDLVLIEGVDFFGG